MLDYAYWNAITDAASEQAYQQTGDLLDRLIALEQNQDLPDTNPLCSYETDPNHFQLGPFSFAQEHTDEFLQLLDALEPEAKDLVVGYYLLRKKQTTLGRIHQRSQVVVGCEIAQATQQMASAVVLSTHPTQDQLHRILTDAHMDQITIHERLFSLSELAYRYLTTNNFTELTTAYRIRPADLRKQLKRASVRLLASPDLTSTALGHLLRRLYLRSAPRKQQPQALTSKTVTDPAILGQHDINVADPNLECLFESGSEPTH